MCTANATAFVWRQVEPNAVNVEGFHSPVLEAGEKYHSVTAYRFYIK